MFDRRHPDTTNSASLTNIVKSHAGLLASLCSLPCSSAAAQFKKAIPQDISAFQVSLTSLLPILLSQDYPMSTRILSAFIIYSLYAPHSITLNAFYEPLRQAFDEERRAALLMAQESGQPSPNEQLVWVVWKILRGAGEDIAPFTPDSLARSGLPTKLRPSHLNLNLNLNLNQSYELTGAVPTFEQIPTSDLRLATPQLDRDDSSPLKENRENKAADTSKSDRALSSVDPLPPQSLLSRVRRLTNGPYSLEKSGQLANDVSTDLLRSVLSPSSTKPGPLPRPILPVLGNQPPRPNIGLGCSVACAVDPSIETNTQMSYTSISSFTPARQNDPIVVIPPREATPTGNSGNDHPQQMSSDNAPSERPSHHRTAPAASDLPKVAQNDIEPLSAVIETAPNPNPTARGYSPPPPIINPSLQPGINTGCVDAAGEEEHHTHIKVTGLFLKARERALTLAELKYLNTQLQTISGTSLRTIVHSSSLDGIIRHNAHAGEFVSSMVTRLLQYDPDEGKAFTTPDVMPCDNSTLSMDLSIKLYIQALQRLPPSLAAFDLMAKLARSHHQIATRNQPSTSGSGQIPNPHPSKLLPSDFKTVGDLIEIVVLIPFVSNCIAAIEGWEEDERSGLLNDDRVSRGVRLLCMFYKALVSPAVSKSPFPTQSIRGQLPEPPGATQPALTSSVVAQGLALEMRAFSLRHAKYADAHSLYAALAAWNV